MMSIRSRGHSARQRAQQRSSDAGSAAAEQESPAPSAETEASGGWHVSSIDLREGLEVTELSSDSLPADWAETHLR